MPDGGTVEKLAPQDIDMLAPLWRALLDHVAALPGAVVPIPTFPAAKTFNLPFTSNKLAGAVVPIPTLVPSS